MAPALNAQVAAESVFQTVTPGWFPGPYHPALQAPKRSFRGAELLSFSATYLYPAPNWTDSPGPQTSTEAHPKHDETAPEKDTTQKCSEAPLHPLYAATVPQGLSRLGQEGWAQKRALDPSVGPLPGVQPLQAHAGWGAAPSLRLSSATGHRRVSFSLPCFVF